MSNLDAFPLNRSASFYEKEGVSAMQRGCWEDLWKQIKTWKKASSAYVPVSSHHLSPQASARLKFFDVNMHTSVQQQYSLMDVLWSWMTSFGKTVFIGDPSKECSEELEVGFKAKCFPLFSSRAETSCLFLILRHVREFIVFRGSKRISSYRRHLFYTCSQRLNGWRCCGTFDCTVSEQSETCFIQQHSWW